MGIEKKEKLRIAGLDWLRGICAISIMFFHYFGKNTDNTILSKLGVYGVSIFFILSGLSMAIVYNKFIKGFKSSVNFYIRRIFRIIPLHFIVCLLVILPILYHTGTYNWRLFVLNITTLFGFIAPSKYISMGAWSIGNEMVYYVLTPIVLLVYNYKKLFGNIFLLIAVLIGLYFAFYRLYENINLDHQWPTYVYPFNNFFLYVSGIGLYYNFSDKNINSRLNLSILFLSLLIFVFLPFKERISIVTGCDRILYCILSIIIVFCFYKMKITKLNLVGKLFEQFGMATYGVYLLHPVIKLYLSYLIQSRWLLLILSVFLTIILALTSYYLIENKIIKIGKKIQLK